MNGKKTAKITISLFVIVTIAVAGLMIFNQPSNDNAVNDTEDESPVNEDTILTVYDLTREGGDIITLVKETVDDKEVITEVPVSVNAYREYDTHYTYTYTVTFTNVTGTPVIDKDTFQDNDNYGIRTPMYEIIGDNTIEVSEGLTVTMTSFGMKYADGTEHNGQFDVTHELVSVSGYYYEDITMCDDTGYTIITNKCDADTRETISSTTNHISYDEIKEVIIN